MTPTGEIFFCGDPHGRFAQIRSAVLEDRPAAVVLLGDIQPAHPLQVEIEEVLGMTQVWWIHGNHDTDSEDDYDNLFASTLGDRSLHGRVVEIAGVRIAGLGGVFRGKVWDGEAPPRCDSAEEMLRQGGKGNRWRGGIPLRHRGTIFKADVDRLAAMRADVVVTHEAPSVHPMGSGAITRLAQAMQVSATFHGHHHQSIDYGERSASLGFKAYGVGLAGITDLHGRVVVPPIPDS
jgi:predicted phosphodiesterase